MLQKIFSLHINRECVDIFVTLVWNSLRSLILIHLEELEILEGKTDFKLLCYHCGDECSGDSISIDKKVFCCNGCKTVYRLLNESNLCEYYAIDQNPGISRKHHIKSNYEFLDDPDLKQKLIDFTNGKRTTITFDVLQIHCSSCIWILENLYRLDEGIISSKVNFLQKKIYLQYWEDKTSLRKIVELMDSIGYEPRLNLENKKEEKSRSEYKNLYYKIGIAGFCFGNIMLLSFPEYLSISISEQEHLKHIFAYINIILALPVFFFSSGGYFTSAWKGLKKKIINIDVPIAIGVFVLFFRSLIEIVFFNGAGYLDSLSGLIFFLLTGKLFQNKTYDTLNFERNYKSYFPIAVTILRNSKETTIPVEKLAVGSRLIIRNNELIPADAVLIKGKANIDYSFVTGESVPVSLQNGNTIYAGGKQIGSAVEVETVKEVSQSYLTQLWNNKAFHEERESRISSLANAISKHFTFVVIAIAVVAGLYWLPNYKTAFDAFTSVLIIACPCALALSTPFTLGNVLRIFGKNKFYLKNTHAIEKLASVEMIVFDKTGTITENGSAHVRFVGDNLSREDKMLIKSTVRNSSHPLSRAVFHFLDTGATKNPDYYEERIGRGIHAEIENRDVKIGSANFVGYNMLNSGNDFSTEVYVSIDNHAKGFFSITNKYRQGLEKVVSGLEKDYELALLSGDNEGEKEKLKKYFTSNNKLYFRQSPHDKLNFVQEQQNLGKKVMMIGDGLNDAGALKQSDAGISISDDTNNFSPACDGILDSDSFYRLKDFIAFSKTSKKIIIVSFILSFVYNLIGLGFAFQGLLSPLIAAILMPISSVSVVLFTTAATNLIARRRGLI